MSAEQDQARELAERIARRLASSGGEGAARGEDPAGGPAGDLATLRAGLAEIQRRLTHIESHLGHDEPCGEGAREGGASREGGEGGAASSGEGARPAWLSGTYVPAAHPSQERFQLDEAVSEIVDFFEREKVCTVEPGGKPCDHCAMCSSRGF